MSHDTSFLDDKWDRVVKTLEFENKGWISPKGQKQFITMISRSNPLTNQKLRKRIKNLFPMNRKPWLSILWIPSNQQIYRCQKNSFLICQCEHQVADFTLTMELV